MFYFDRSRNGFSLLEVMIALAIFTVGILAVASLSGTSLNGLNIAQGNFYDSTAAARHIEDILSRPYTDAVLMDTDNGYDPSSPDHGPFDIGIGGPTIEWEVQDDFPTTGTKRISMTVRRSDRRGGRTFTYEYVKAKDFR